jgi:membrane associated rhomboid family serine protease
MLPIGDRNPTRTTPFVNYALIAANIAVFVWEYLVMLGGGES